MVRRAGLFAAFTAVLACCTAADPRFGFSIERIDARQVDGAIAVTLRQRLRLSPEAQEALIHGVPLTLSTTVELRETGARGRKTVFRRQFEIEYLPLSDRYRLTSLPGAFRTFPRLRHVLAAMSELELQLADAHGGGGALEVRARSTLERGALPPPMQLPAWLSASWRHDSGWHQYRFEPAPAA